MPHPLIRLVFVCFLLPAWAGEVVENSLETDTAERTDLVGESDQVAPTAVKDGMAMNQAAPAILEQPEPSRSELKAMADRVASRHGLDRDLVHALIRAESAYNPQAVSAAGAIGLMQVMPGTAADYGVGSVDRLFEPETNLSTGMRHLKRLLDKYGNIGSAVMAYNAGEGALERSNGFVTYAETQRYTHQVLTNYLNKKGIAPYSTQAREVVGINLTPAMASARSSGGVARHRVQTSPAKRDEATPPLEDLRWQPAIKRPALNAQLSLMDNRNRSSSPRSPALKRSSLRVMPPRYAIKPGGASVSKRR